MRFIPWSTRPKQIDLAVIAFAGDSITDQNSATNLYGTRGYASWLKYLTECPFDFVPRLVSAYDQNPDYDFGYGSYSPANFLNGKPSGDGVYPMTDIATADPNVVFVCLGSNTGSSDIASILAIWDQFIADGREVIGSEILPRKIGTFGYTSERLATCYANNATLKAAAAARGMLFAEWAHTVTETPGSDASLLYTSDGVHPNIQGAYRMGDYLRTFLAPYLPPAFSVPASGSPLWLTNNPYMTGDVSGGAAGFTFTGHASRSKVTDGDGTVWQRITSSQAFNASDTLRQSAGTTTAVAGDVVRGVCRVRPVASGWDITGLQLLLYSTVSGSTTLVRTDMYVTTQTAGLLFNPSAGLLMTPAYTVPAGATGLFTYLINHGSGTMDVRQLGAIKVG